MLAEGAAAAAAASSIDVCDGDGEVRQFSGKRNAMISAAERLALCIDACCHPAHKYPALPAKTIESSQPRLGVIFPRMPNIPPFVLTSGIFFTNHA